MYAELIDEKLVELDFEANSLEELFVQVNEKLSALDLVEDAYLEKLTERERDFPTGLATQNLNIGLPHCDPEFVKEAFIFIARNNQPVRNLQMGDNAELMSKDFLFLGIKNPSEQVGLLSKLMEIFSDEEFVNEYIEITDAKTMVERVQTKL